MVVLRIRTSTTTAAHTELFSNLNCRLLLCANQPGAGKAAMTADLPRVRAPPRAACGDIHHVRPLRSALLSLYHDFKLGDWRRS